MLKALTKCFAYLCLSTLGSPKCCKPIQSHFKVLLLHALFMVHFLSEDMGNSNLAKIM